MRASYTKLAVLVALVGAVASQSSPRATPDTSNGTLDAPLTEAISRAYTLTNRTPETVEFNEAISRAYTLTNRTPSVPSFNEAISRALTVVNRPVEPLRQAISRAYTVTNREPDVPVIREAISRAHTVRNNLLILDGITPDHGGDTGRVTVNITGNNFDPGATAELSHGEGGAQVVVPGRTGALSVDETRLTVTFDLAGVSPRGQWDLTVTNPDGHAGRLPAAFTLEEGVGARIWIDVLGRQNVRVNLPATFFINYGNSGDVDNYDALLTIRIPAGVPYQLGVPLVDFGIPELGEITFPLGAVMDGETFIPLWVYSLPSRRDRSIWLRVTVPPSYDQAQLPITATLTALGGTVFARTGGFEYVDESHVLNVAFDSARERYETLRSRSQLHVRGEIDLPPVDWEERRDAFFTSVQQKEEYIRVIQHPITVLDWLKKIWWFIWNVIQNLMPFNTFITLMDPDATTGLILFANYFEERYGPLLDEMNSVTGQASPQVVVAVDPNEKTGRSGFAGDRFLAAEEALHFEVFFENDPDEATAPARDVIITDHLDTANLNPAALSLGEIAFGQERVAINLRTSEFTPTVREATTVVDLRPETDLLVRIEVLLNLNTGVVMWQFTSLDPVTGDPPDDPLVGFLPPNQNPPEGEGSVTFSILPKEGVTTGTEICNKAEIVFDANEPVVACAPDDEPPCPGWCNTIDADGPSSAVDALPPETNVTCPPTIELTWSGQDQVNGSGVRSYSVFVSTDGGEFMPIVQNTVETSTAYAVELDHIYALYSRATDNVGNVEDAPGEADTITAIRPNADLTADDVVDLADFAAFLRCGDVACASSCLTGPNGTGAPDCRAADLDCDDSIDLRDIALLQLGFGPK